MPPCWLTPPAPRWPGWCWRRSAQVAAQGLADVDLGMAGVTLAEDSKYFDGLSWPEIRQRWREAIEALADEYAAGVALTWPIVATT